MCIGARIINVTSDASYLWTTPFDPSDLDHSVTIETRENIQVGQELPGPLGFALYQRTKLLQIMFTREMQRRLEKSEQYKTRGITVHTYHPGEFAVSRLSLGICIDTTADRTNQNYHLESEGGSRLRESNGSDYGQELRT